MSVDELGEAIGKNIQNTNNLNHSMSHPAGEDTNIVFPTETVELEERKIVITQRDTSTDTIWDRDDFTWDNDNWDESYDNSPVEIMRNRWEWTEESELDDGSYDDNINITNGDIRLDI